MRPAATVFVLALVGCGNPQGAMDLSSPADAGVHDLAVRDLATQDLITHDLAMPDLAMPDLAMPDLSMPDLAMPDLSMPDLAMPDLRPPADLEPSPDLQPPPDLEPPPDLTPPPPDLTYLVSLDRISGTAASTLAGSSTAGYHDDTDPTMVLFTNPTGIARAADGTLFVAEYDGNRVRAIDPTSGATTTALDGAAQVGVTFAGPFAVAIGSDGTLYVQTDFDATGAKNSQSGTIWSIASGTAVEVISMLGRPRGLAGLSGGDLFVADHARETVSLLDPSVPTLTPLAGTQGTTGLQDGTGTGALFSDPYGAAELPDHSVIVADASNHCLRQVKLDGTVVRWAGDGVSGSVDGPRLTARFDTPRDVAVDAAGDVFVADIGSHLIRRIASDVAQTVAGDGTAGYAEGSGDTAEFYGLEGIEVAPDGKTVYVTDGNEGDASAHNRVRFVTIP